MRIVAVGRLKHSAEVELYRRYASRVRPALQLTEVPDGHGAPVEIKRREAESILGHLAGAACVVALDQGGTAYDSEGFSRQLEAWLGAGRELVFVLGGAEGLDKTVLLRANFMFSFGRLTWPHTLARTMLAEQIFRARSIAAGHPYHRAGRPQDK